MITRTATLAVVLTLALVGVATAQKPMGYEKCMAKSQGDMAVYCESLERCSPGEARAMGRKAWRRPHGPRKSDRRAYRRLRRCALAADRPAIRREWRRAKRRS